MLISKTRDGSPVTFDRAARDGKQLIDYAHNNPEFSTVLPCDAITISGVIYMHVMFTKGLANERWCEVLTSKDNGQTWQRGQRLDANNNGRGRIMVTWDIKPGSDWVDIFTTTGLARNQPIFRYRCLKDRLGDYNSWEGWGWNGKDWGWGRTPSAVLPGEYGELSFRYIQGNAVLAYFDKLKYRVSARVGRDADADWTRAPEYVIETGQRLSQLYGGYIHPDSRFDGKFIFIVSQWVTATGSPYQAIQYEALLQPVAPLDNTKRTDIRATTPTPAPVPGGTPVAKPAFDLRIQLSNNNSSRNGKQIEAVGEHTQEGPGTAASLANYCCGRAEVSYHLVVDNNRNVVRLVPSDRASWSVGNANPVAVGICFAGSYSAWTTDEWHQKMGNGMEIAAYLSVAECQAAGIDPRVVSIDELKRGVRGITDHNGINLGILKTPGHTDCGPNFPWPWFAERVKYYAVNGIADAPVRNLINECAAANTWLGKRVTEGEGIGKDDGRWAHFENGVVYWKRNAEAAYAIKYSESWPRYVKGTEEGQYEYSRLGYPIGPRIELVKFTKSDGTVVPGGTVQTFEGGSIYWQEDPAIGDGYIVAGGIKPLYASLGYETGPLGWPTGEEKLTADRAYVTQTFAHGTVVWHLATGSAIVLSTGGEVIYPKA